MSPFDHVMPACVRTLHKRGIGRADIGEEWACRVVSVY
jgi:hypothetical protein